MTLKIQRQSKVTLVQTPLNSNRPCSKQTGFECKFQYCAVEMRGCTAANDASKTQTGPEIALSSANLHPSRSEIPADQPRKNEL